MALNKLLGIFFVTTLISINFAYAEQTNLTRDVMYEAPSYTPLSIDSKLTADPIAAFINENPETASDVNIDQGDLWVRIRDGFEIPDIDSEYTAKYETWYSTRPDYVKRMMERSQKYLFHIVEEVEKRGMPTEIALLPMIESAYNPQANSTSNAVGIWQFVPATGNYFGLKQNYWSDKRRDVTAATSAALTYLQKLHGMFGSWDLALAAYNAGEGTVSRAIERNRKQGLATDYQSLDLPAETRNYVPKLQAIKNIVFDPERYGLTLNAIPNRPYFTNVLAPKQIDSKLAAKLAEISYEEFISLNPSYNRPVIVSNNEVHQLLLPTWAAAKFRENLANYDKPLTSWQPYVAKRGERIDYIAEKFNINASQLRQINNLPTNKKMVSSRPILVPTNNGDETNLMLADFKIADKINDTNHKNNVENERNTVKTITYKVKKGDTLSSLASKFKVNKNDLLRANLIKKGNLKAGQVIKVSRSEFNQVRTASFSKKSVKVKPTKRLKNNIHSKKNATNLSRFSRIKANKSKSSAKSSSRKSRVSSRMR